MTLATVSWALKPPTTKYPLGFAKVESLGSVAVSGLLVIGGVYMGMSALNELLSHFAPALMESLQQMHLVSCGHGHSHAIPDLKAAWIAGGSVVVKEWLYRASKLKCYFDIQSIDFESYENREREKVNCAGI
jgi:divalent metal cation (Fe/Co/Zn/Cd) transporter